MRAMFALVIGVVVLLVGAAPASAGNGVTRVAGLLEPDTSAQCTAVDNQGAYVATGSLVGCWYVTTFENVRTNPGGGFYADGTETFVGCLGDACGQFFTTYTFTAKYAGDTELHGRCHHPIIGGTGDFAGVSGVINMHDLPNGCVAYQGGISGVG